MIHPLLYDGVGWDEVCIFQFSASFSRLLYVFSFFGWFHWIMVSVYDSEACLWFLCIIPTHCSMMGWVGMRCVMCIFQFSASFSRLLHVFFCLDDSIELWFLCMIPRLVNGLLGHPLCSHLVLFPLPCYKLKSETHRLIPDSFHRFHSETVTIAHFQKSCRKTLFYPSSCRIFSSAHFGGAWHYRVVLNNPIAGRLCYWIRKPFHER